MQSDKAKIAQLVAMQPDDSTYEDIVREIVFHLMIERGLKDSDAGRVITRDALWHRIRPR